MAKKNVVEQSVVLVKPDGVQRGLIGPTYPQTASPGTIRGDYSFDSPGNAEEAAMFN